MRHWTQDGAYVAGFAALVVGSGCLIAGSGWPAVAVVALAVALLSVVRATESREATIKALDVAATVAEMRKQLDGVISEAPKTRETAESALRTAREAWSAKQRQQY